MLLLIFFISIYLIDLIQFIFDWAFTFVTKFFIKVRLYDLQEHYNFKSDFHILYFFAKALNLIVRFIFSFIKSLNYHVKVAERTKDDFYYCIFIHRLDFFSYFIIKILALMKVYQSLKCSSASFSLKFKVKRKRFF